MTLLGSVDIPFTKSTKIAVDATDTAGQAATVAQQATDAAGQAQATAQTASQTATQAAATAAGAAQAAQTAITTANGKNKAYYGATTPTSPQPGDIWFVEDGNNNVTAIKHYDGTQWVTDVDNTALAQQISAAQAAADNAVTVGQTAQQVAQQAAQVGDSAAKAAEVAQQAANAAQTDAADAVTQANNAVNTANKATQDAQDAIDKAQDGFDQAQSALTTANNATDTANTAKQVASDAATQASTAKTNAQTAMSNAQDAINKANAANANANTREKSIIKSNTAPSNPVTDQLWIDTSKTPQIMRRWTGSTWVDLSPTQANQIGAVSTTTYTTDITNINNTLSQKASVTTVNTLSGRVDKAETAITQNANDIALKADKNVVDTLKNTVDNHSTLISQNANAIEQKASQSTVDALTGRVSTAEATLTTQANEIAARITKTDADAKYATQTALTATATSLTSNISSVQTNLDNLQVGGRNYVLNSDKEIIIPHPIDGFTQAVFDMSDIVKNSVNKETYTISFDAVPYTEGTNAFHSIVIGSSAGGDNWSHRLYIDNDFTITKNADGSSHYVATFTVDRPNGQDFGISQRFIAENGATGGTIKNLTVVRGNKEAPWSPAPEDMATQSQISQLSDDINLRVQKGDVINQINVSTEGILIDGKRVHITGQTTIDNAVIKDAMIDSMTANKLTAGTIDANVITVKNINASNIVTGTLDASKATVANIDASKITTGTLNAARIAAGSIDASKLAAGTITAESGVIGSLDASKITTGTLDAAMVNVVNLNADNIVSGTLKAIKIEGAYGTFTGTVEGATIKSSDRPSFSDPNFTNRAMLSNGTLSIESRNDDVGAYGQVKIDGGRLQALGVPGIFTMPDPYKPPKDNFTNYGSGYIYSANNLFINARKVAFGSANESNLNIDAWDGKINLKDGSIYAGVNGDLVIKSGSNRVCFGDDKILSNTPLSILAWSDHGRIEGITGVSMNTLDSNNFSHFYAGVWGEFRVTSASDTDTYKPVRASSFPTGSLAEFKTEITKWEVSALDIINSADIYQYRLKDDVKNGKDKVRHGLVIGEGYRTPSEVIDGDGVEQYEMNSLSWKAIQELSASDSSNKERLSILEEQNNNLLLKIADLEARLAKLEA